MILVDRIVALRCRSPCGERGLKFTLNADNVLLERRSPCGERGLKYESRLPVSITSTVAPRAGSVG